MIAFGGNYHCAFREMVTGDRQEITFIHDSQIIGGEYA